MSFPRYPKYKDSGVEWLGPVPADWEVKRLSWLCEKIGSGKTPSGGSEIYVTEGIIFIRSQNVYDDGLFLDDIVYISDEIDEELKSTRVHVGDILLNITGASLGRTCIVPPDFPSANVNQHVCIIRMRESAMRKFVALAMKSYSIKMQIDAAQTGAAREGLNFAQIAKLVLVIPPEEDRPSIASFLDRETAKIDALIAEQQRLIELLNEKRQAVISHAVTKGLDPHAPMKPSGIEWLGDVPAHWEVRPLKLVCRLFGRIGYRGYTTEDIVDEGDGAVTLSPSNIADGVVSLEDSTFISWAKYEESPEIMLQQNDVVMVKTGSTLGKVGFVSQLPHPATINPQLVIFKYITCASRFLFFVLNTSYVQSLIDVSNSGSTIPTMTQEAIGRFRCVFPPPREQEAIVKYLDGEIDALSLLIAEAGRAIILLQERRAALISAAVTGEIDVRGLVEAEAA